MKRMIALLLTSVICITSMAPVYASTQIEQVTTSSDEDMLAAQEPTEVTDTVTPSEQTSIPAETDIPTETALPTLTGTPAIAGEDAPSDNAIAKAAPSNTPTPTPTPTPTIPATVGWVKIADIFYYYLADGTQLKSTTKIIDGYYRSFDAEGRMITNSFVKESDGYHYANEWGCYLKNTWQKIDGYYRYFDNASLMVTGWHMLDGYWRYLNEWGCLLTNQFVLLDNYYRYQNEWGCMITGWQKIDGYYRYFSLDWGHMVTGWQTLDGYQRYFNEWGCMLTGWQTIDGYDCYFNEWGCLISRNYSYYAAAMQQVRSVVDSITNAAMTPETKLRTCYNYVADRNHERFSYLRKYGENLTRYNGWVEHDCYEMLTTHQGNCYNFAATFGMMAQYLGYPANVIAGKTAAASGGYTVHGWVEIVMDGTNYIFDPEMEFAKGYDLWKQPAYRPRLTYVR